MYPAVQLIQLTLRIEREAEAQRRAYMVDSVERVKAKPVRLPERTRRLVRNFDPLDCKPADCVLE